MRIERFDSSIGINRLNDELKTLSDADFVHIKHNIPEAKNLNLITVSRKRPEYRETLRTMTSHGFHIYKRKDDITSFAAFKRIPGLWTEVESGKIYFDENSIAYTLNEASVKKRQRLLVIFSSIATQSHQSSLKRHFEHNFSSIAKYTTPNTNILRIADLGGVGGGWYVNTMYLRNNFANVRALIIRKCMELAIDIADVVFLGVSKGATAALLHGLLMDTRVVSVDPIVSDELYRDLYDDLHFTVGNFPLTKDEIFSAYSTAKLPFKEGKVTVIFSDRSPQYKYISERLMPWSKDRISYINVSHPKIKDHPDVGPNSLSTITMLVNMQLHGIDMPIGQLDTPFGTKLD